MFKNPYESLEHAKKRIQQIDFEIPKLMNERAECKQRIAYLHKEFFNKKEEEQPQDFGEDII